MVVEQGLNGEKVSPRSLAWLQYDDKALYVAVDNTIAPNTSPSTGSIWGQDDAVEFAFRNPAAGKNAPIIILRGYPNGHFESSSEAGAPASVVTQAAQGVDYKAKSLGKGRWVAEWRIPFASLGLDPQKVARLEFNLSIRKIVGEQWVEWQGTSAATWDAPKAGIIELVR